MTKGDMFIMHLPGVPTTGLDGRALCYVMLKAASSNKYRILILAEPHDWWSAPEWNELRVNWSPLKTAFRYEYRMCRGNLSTYTVSKKEWMNTLIPTMAHKYVGNLLESVEKLKK